jgi:hypothetical protein
MGPPQRPAKLTLITGPRLKPFGLWIEQLLAESTGKQGTGIVPIVGEPLGAAAVYGDDRLFVRLRLHGGDPEEHDRDGKVERLRAAGFPIVTINLKEPAAIGAEFVRWEIATATAGAILDINPFDEPNVQQAKDATRALLARYEADGKLPQPAAQVSGDGVALLRRRHLAEARMGATDARPPRPVLDASRHDREITPTCPSTRPPGARGRPRGDPRPHPRGHDVRLRAAIPTPPASSTRAGRTQVFITSRRIRPDADPRREIQPGRSSWLSPSDFASLEATGRQVVPAPRPRRPRQSRRPSTSSSRRRRLMSHRRDTP